MHSKPAEICEVKGGQNDCSWLAVVPRCELGLGLHGFRGPTSALQNCESDDFYADIRLSFLDAY